MKRLPINKTPFIRSYPMYLFQDIIMNNKRTNADVLAQIYIKNYSVYEWNVYSRNADVEVNRQTGVIQILKKDYDIDSSKSLFRKFNLKKDEIVIRIDYQQFTNSWDSLAIFVDKDNSYKKIDSYSGLDLLIGKYCNESFYARSGRTGFYESLNGESYNWLKICAYKGIISAYVSLDGDSWKEYELPEKIKYEENDVVSVGFACYLLDNCYFKWTANNFIQLSFDANNDIALNYADFLFRNCKNYVINPHIKFSSLSYKVINALGKMNVIKALIDDNYYIEVWLNERYIPDTVAFDIDDYVHENLVYGYDETTQTIDILSFIEGKPLFHTISWQAFELAYENTDFDKSDVNLLRFQPDNNSYHMDIFHIYNMLIDYLCGYNTSQEYAHFYTGNSEGAFGVNIYKNICGNDENKTIFLADRRNAFLLNEHKKIMRERFKYIKEYGFIPASEEKVFEEILADIVEYSEKVLNLVLKNQLKPREGTQKDIFVILSEIEKKEKYLYKRFVRWLEII